MTNQSQDIDYEDEYTDGTLILVERNIAVNYRRLLEQRNLPTHNKNGEPMMYQQLWHTCIAYELCWMKHEKPSGYEMLTIHAGGEFELLERMLTTLTLT